MGGTCCTAHDDDDEIFMNESQFHQSLLQEMELKEQLALSLRQTQEESRRRMHSRMRRLTVEQSIALSLRAYASHQEEYDLTRQVLEKLDKEVYDEIRTLKSPPQSLFHILATAALILGETDLEWRSVQKFFLHCKKKLLGYDFDNGDRDAIIRAKEYANKNVHFLNEDRSRFASECGYYIFVWCRDIFQMDNHRNFLETNDVTYEIHKLFSTRSFMGQKQKQDPSQVVVVGDDGALQRFRDRAESDSMDEWDMDHVWMNYNANAYSTRSFDELLDLLDNTTPDTPVSRRVGATPSFSPPLAQE